MMNDEGEDESVSDMVSMLQQSLWQDQSSIQEYPSTLQMSRLEDV